MHTTSRKLIQSRPNAPAVHDKPCGTCSVYRRKAHIDVALGEFVHCQVHHGSVLLALLKDLVTNILVPPWVGLTVCVCV